MAEKRKIRLSQDFFERCFSTVDALSDGVVEVSDARGLDLEAVFRAQYRHVARIIARVIRDRGRAEELAVDVFLKWSRNRRPQDENTEAWLYRAAVRTGLNELRRETRQTRYERLFDFARKAPTPEELYTARGELQKVDVVLSAMAPRQAELLLLRSHGLSYDELAAALDLNPKSVGTLLARAQRTFRKEYIRRYDKP